MNVASGREGEGEGSLKVESLCGCRPRPLKQCFDFMPRSTWKPVSLDTDSRGGLPPPPSLLPPRRHEIRVFDSARSRLPRFINEASLALPSNSRDKTFVAAFHESLPACILVTDPAYFNNSP